MVHQKSPKHAEAPAKPKQPSGSQAKIPPSGPRPMAPSKKAPPPLTKDERRARAADAPHTEIGDIDEFSAPPIAGKEHPPDMMDEMVPTLDDADRMFRHHPNEPISEGFSFDPQGADAAADLAGDLGAEFLEGATEGRDMSDVIMEDEERSDEEPFLVEDLNEEGEDMYVQEDELVPIEQTANEPRQIVSDASRKRARRT